MTDKHTPTNWNFKHEFAKHYSITHNGYWIGRMRGKENAQLVSAAPDLLEALQGIIGYFDSGNSVSVSQATIKASSDEIKAARAAIAKATSKVP